MGGYNGSKKFHTEETEIRKVSHECTNKKKEFFVCSTGFSQSLRYRFSGVDSSLKLLKTPPKGGSTN